MKGRHQKHMEASKRLLLCVGIIFAITVGIGTVAAFLGADISFFAAVIGVTGGVFGSTIVSYEIKAKMENVVKIKMAIVKFRLAIGGYLNPEQIAQVERDIEALELALDQKIDESVRQAVSQDPDIPMI